MILKLENIKKEYKVNKRYNEVIFDNLNLEFKSGEFVCILGESGSGKSTLMNIIGGIDLNYYGNIYINDRNLRNIDIDSYRRSNVGFIFQNFNLISNLNVLENVMLKLDMEKNKKSEKISKAKSVLKKLGLENEIYKKPNELSGGQKQRVAIARTLVTNPDIILADEPTGALDSENGIKVLEILKEISNEGKLVIVVTHSKKVIDYSSRVITISDGKILKDDIISNVHLEHKNVYSKSKKISISTSIKFGFRNIIKNLKRNILITIASSIGIIGVILNLYIGDGVKKFIDDEISEKANPKILDIKKKGTNELYEVDYFNDVDIDNILKIKNVEKIYKHATYSNSTSISYDNKKYDLVSFSSYNKIDKNELLKGEIPKANEIVISKYLADKISNKKDYSDILNKQVDLYLLDNSTFEPFIINEKVNISGIYKNGSISIIEDSMYAYISYDSLNNLYKNNEKKLLATSLSLEASTKDDIDKIKESINKLNFECSNLSDLLKGVYEYLDIATFILSGFSAISLIVSSIMIMVVMHINVVERTKEIGIFRSLGARSKDIKRIFKSESIVLGSLVGILSIFMSKLISILMRSIIYSNFKIKFSNIDINFMLFGLALSIFVFLISSINPAKKASIIDPIDALRYE